jgi:hypothetical protein
MYACWTVKGGSGTTVFASALALTLAERNGKATIIDFGGDVPSVLGMAEPVGRGIRDWLATSDRDPQHLDNLRVSATSRLSVVPVGSAVAFDESAFDDLVAASDDHTVFDFGMLRPPESLRRAARGDWLVIRPCYLALRRAARLAQRPGGVVLMNEGGRSLTARDVQAVVGAAIVGEITVADGVARSVDAGLLATRLPKQLSEELGAML